MSNSIIVFNSIHLQQKLLSLFSTSENALIISPFINFSNIFNKCNGNMKIATNFSAEIFIKGSSDIDFFIKANERNYEIKHIDNLLCFQYCVFFSAGFYHGFEDDSGAVNQIVECGRNLCSNFSRINANYYRKQLFPLLGSFQIKSLIVHAS